VDWKETGLSEQLQVNPNPEDAMEDPNKEDPTENIRREMVDEINSAKSDRQLMEVKYGQVWDTMELQRDFAIESFMAPFCMVVRKSDGVKGTVMFQHMPRFYFSFEKA
jgi:hypothetical protein